VFAATAGTPRLHVDVLDHQLNLLHSVSLPAIPGEPGDGHLAVNRITLREILLSGLGDAVYFGARFTHFSTEHSGTVTAHFADGTSAVGDVLVAADGAHSAVRAQYLPNAVLRPAGITSISAKIPLTRDALDLLPDESRQGLSLVFAPKGFMCIWHVMRFGWDERGGVKDSAAGNDAELLKAWPGMLYDNTRDYIMWGLWAAEGKFPDGTVQMRGQELIDLALRLTPTWHPDFRALFARSDPSTAFPLSIVTSEPVPAWKTTSITLLGDAIHTMTPGQGVGANTSLRDAQLLGRELAAVQRGEKELLSAIANYEAEMIPYGFARVADSLAQNGTSGGDPLHKPVIGRAVLSMNRAYFRAVDKVPSLQRKFLEDLYTYRGAEDSPVTVG
jgi:2-polyprenyl-6-methoxyphenol hydroxylase-like FAD-dependent oxidoreductase